MKLLNKFGFSGRLGAREDGVSRAVEVVVRPNGQGLGFGDFTESSALVVNKKLVAEWSGVEYKEEEIIEIKKTKKIITEQIADSKSWKKNKNKNENEKSNVRTVSVNDYINGKGEEDKKLVIIDMRGEQTRVLTDYSEINTIPMEEKDNTPKIGQELLYNINLVVDLLEIDVTKESKKLSQESKKVHIISSEINLLEDQLKRDLPRLKRIESVMQILKKVSEKQKNEILHITEQQQHQKILMKRKNRDTEDDESEDENSVNKSKMGTENEPYEIYGSESESVSISTTTITNNNNNNNSGITLSAITSLFQTLHSNFTEEFHIFGLINLLPSMLFPVMSKLFNNWQPLSDPMLIADINIESTVLCDYFDKVGERTLTAQTRYTFFIFILIFILVFILIQIRVYVNFFSNIRISFLTLVLDTYFSTEFDSPNILFFCFSNFCSSIFFNF